MSTYDDFSTYLAEYGVKESVERYFTHHIPKTAQAFAPTVNDETKGAMDFNFATDLAQSTFCTAGDIDYDQYFDPLIADSTQFSIHLIKSNPNIIVVVSSSPIESQWKESNALNNSQVVVLNLKSGSTKPLLSNDKALFLFHIGTAIQGIEITIPLIPIFSPLQNQQPWLKGSLSHQENLVTKAIAYGYVQRFDDVKPPKDLTSVLQFLQQNSKFEWSVAHPVQQKILIQAFYNFVNELRNNISQLDEENTIDWFIQRDKLHSLTMVVSEWEPNRALIMALQNLDTQFPHTTFSALLPDSQLLRAAYQHDPMCWWGKAAQMRYLYDRLLHNH
jgi:hypothetical protein